MVEFVRLHRQQGVQVNVFPSVSSRSCRDLGRNVNQFLHSCKNEVASCPLVLKLLALFCHSLAV